MQDKITKEKIKKYIGLTEKAIELVKKKIVKKHSKEASEIIDMSSNYFSDALFFEKKGDYVNAFAAINYAHGWIDCGVRLGFFSVTDDKLFTVR
ncbi:MAG TPA: DUF357 domain-containing protein [Candidatus Paceibacterota bacterium]|nr:DUF357 domain-containing protein [Candidatus Paceibacterota bacterium]